MTNVKRFLILFMVLGLLAGSVATTEAKRASKPGRVERTVEGRYGARLEPYTECNQGRALYGCVVVDPRSTEAFFTAKVTDDHGQPVFVQVVDGGGGRIGTFCGETTEPMSFDTGSRLEFLIEPVPHFFSHWGAGWLGPLDCPYRLRSTGTISVTLSNLP